MIIETLINPWLIVSALIIISFTTFLIIIIIKPFSTSSKPHKNSPPSPPTFPILGNLHQLRSSRHPHRSLRQLSDRHGPLMLLRFGCRPVLVASSAAAAREIMKTHDAAFSSRPESKLGHKLLYQGRDITSAPYGEYWRRIRSLCVVHLLNAARVRSFRAVREEETALLVEKLRRRSKSPANLSDMFASLSGDVICRVAFGRKYSGGGGGGESEEAFFKGLMLELMRLLGAFSVGDFIPWLSWVNRVNGLDAQADRVAKAFDEFLDQVVDQHVLKNIEDDDQKVKVDDKKDLVDVLLEIQQGGDNDGFQIDKDSIKPIILDMFVGGTDTTYTVLEWAMTELLRHPNVLKKLQEEAIETAKGKEHISESDLDKMPYLKALIKETLRLHPPLPLTVPRAASRDTEVNGFDVAAGTMVIVNAWAIGRDPAVWDPPEEFMPERFLNSGAAAADLKYFSGSGDHSFQFVPFGGGRRSCPGVLFGMVIVELVMANLVYAFDWALPEGVRPEDLDMEECVGSISHRKTPLLAVATPRF